MPPADPDFQEVQPGPSGAEAGDAPTIPADAAAQPENGEAAAAPSSAPPAPPAMSKRAMKRLQKHKQAEERKRRRKEEERERRREVVAAKQARVKATVEGMGEEEFAAWRAERAAKVAARGAEKEAKKARLRAAMESGQRIVVDLEFPDKMKDTEIRSMVSQVGHAYSVNARAAAPAHLILSGVRGAMKEAMDRQAPEHGKWMVTVTEADYIDHFAAERDALVYLTADSPHELGELDPAKIYVVGGIVDRNRHKGLCFAKAEAQGVATARLPLGAHLKLASSQVMCTNHVVEIMLRWAELRDWGRAFEAVVPTRKRKAEGSEEGGEEEEEEEGAQGDEAEAGAGAEGAEAAVEAEAEGGDVPAA